MDGSNYCSQTFRYFCLEKQKQLYINIFCAILETVPKNWHIKSTTECNTWWKAPHFWLWRSDRCHFYKNVCRKLFHWQIRFRKRTEERRPAVIWLLLFELKMTEKRVKHCRKRRNVTAHPARLVRYLRWCTITDCLSPALRSAQPRIQNLARKL